MRYVVLIVAQVVPLLLQRGVAVEEGAKAGVSTVRAGEPSVRRMGFSSAEINSALSAKGVRGCPMCGNQALAAVDGVLTFSINPDISPLQRRGGPGTPAVATACNNCGFMSFHAADVLGLSS